MANYTETDYLEECEALEEKAAKPAAPPAPEFSQFTADCTAKGLTAKCHHDTHWQIYQNGKPIVDFWPTARKARPVNGKGKARRCDAADAIALAEMLGGGNRPKVKVDDRKARRERIAIAAVAGLLAQPDNPDPKPEWVAGFAVKVADALMADLDKPPVDRDDIADELPEIVGGAKS